jgi:hypothetical protein
MSTQSRRWAAGIILFAGTACAEGGERVSFAPTDVAPIAALAPVAHPTGGYLEHERSPLSPYCHAVLIAPDVVVTASRCAEDGWSELSFGIGEVGGETIPVDAVMYHPEAGEDRGHALVALVLEHPVAGIEPALTAIPEAVPCGVELPSYEIARRGDAAPRHVWTACAIDSEDEQDVESVFLAMDGYPNCHGDSGAGAFLGGPAGTEDRVIGWVTGAGHYGSRHPVDSICVTHVELATVADNLDFLAAARERSRVSVDEGPI